MVDLLCGVQFTSYFSCMDMIEALNGTVGDRASYLDYGYFGVLGAAFDENGVAIGEYTEKPSYYALQAIASVFAGDFELAQLPVLRRPQSSHRIFGEDFNGPTIQSGGFRRPNGAAAFAYWNASDLMTTEFESTVTLQIAGLSGDVRLISLLDGAIYRIPPELMETKGPNQLLLRNIPITDYPLLLTFGEFVQ